MIDDRRRDRHQRGDQVEGADAAFNQPARAAAGADDRDDRRVAAHDERREQEKRPERGHLADLLCDFASSYFDGHFAMMPFGSVWKPPSGVSRPFSTTSAPSWKNVSGTMPVYEAFIDVAVVLDLEHVFEAVRLPHDRSRHDEAVQLQLLVLPLRRDWSSLRRHVCSTRCPRAASTTAGRRKASDEHQRGDADLDISMCHKDFRENDIVRIALLHPDMQGYAPSDKGLCRWQLRQPLDSGSARTFA